MTEPLLTGAEFAGGPIVRGIKRLTREIRVAISVRRIMRRDGYTIDSKALRLVMYKPGFADRLARLPRDDDELTRALARVISPSTPDGVTLLRSALIRAFRSRLEGSTAASEFTEGQMAARHEEVLTVVIEAEDMAWEARLAAMPPLRATQFRDLRTEWPVVTRVVADIASSADRAALLRRWARYTPTFLSDAPPEIFGALADVSADLPSPEDQRVAEQFIERGLERGLEPRPYWRLRILSSRGITAIDDAAEYLRDHRGHPLVEAALHTEGPAAAIEALEGWQTDNHRDELQRRMTLAEYYLMTRRLDEAVTLARQTAAEFDSTVALLLAARGLIARHMIEPTAVHRADLSIALRLTMEARAKRRQWGLDSGLALAMEIRTRRMLSDHQGALDAINGVGEIPASSEEFQNPELIAEAAILQAEFGDADIAKRLQSSASPSKREHIAALLAERDERADDAIRHWEASLDATGDWGEKADLALQLAFHGVRSDFLDELGPDNAQVASEIGLIAGLFGHQHGALEEFRGFANGNHRGTMILYTYYDRDGDLDSAAAVARAGAVRWNDPDLWVQSGRFRLNQGRFADAISDLQSALAAAPDSWGRRSTAYRLLTEAHSAAGDWQEALNAAARLLAEEPTDPSAAWAVAICQARTQDVAGAKQTWLQNGSPEPQSQLEIAAWMELVSEFGDEIGNPQDALKIAARYPTDEPIRRGLLGAFMAGRRPADEPDDIDEDTTEADETEAPDPGRDAFRELLSDYLRDFPDGGIRQVQIDMENPLQAMQDLSGERASNPEIESQILNGQMPVGMAGLMFGKGYLDVLLAREHGPVFSGSRDLESEPAAIQVAHESGVVLDLSALVSLARLPEPLRTQLIGHFANARVLADQHRDAASGARIRSRDSGLSFQPGSGGKPGIIQHRSPDAVKATNELADRVVSSFSQFVTDTHPVLTAFPIGGAESVDAIFLLAADHSVSSELPLWADDHALKDLVRQQGGCAFGTPELLHHLRDEGVVDAALIDLAEATLLNSGYTGLRFRRDVWDLAVTLAVVPQGVINAFKFGGNEQAKDRAQWAMSQIESNIDDPHLMAGYVHALAQWLVRIAPEPAAATHNIQLLVQDLLSRRWMNSSALPYFVNAVRATDAPFDGATVMLQEVYRRFEQLAAAIDEQQAALAVFELISRLDPPDAYRVRSAILARSFE
ncbi:tetratricopeptide repeat protein [Agromyces sp. NPDC056379]|uniref:tetratricopeptide repeat protein n=1 Tax=unclassified Agromyces TaxID=2639701 RepID=UPI0035DF9E9E